MPYITKAYKRQKLVRSKEKRSNHIEIVIESSDARESQILYERLKRAIQKMNRRTHQKVSYRIERRLTENGSVSNISQAWPANSEGLAGFSTKAMKLQSLKWSLFVLKALRNGIKAGKINLTDIIIITDLSAQNRKKLNNEMEEGLEFVIDYLGKRIIDSEA